jgi:hypothetical protein
MCAYFLVCNFAGFLLPLYALVSVLQVLDRYRGHLCPIPSTHKGYRMSNILDTLRNSG